MNKRTRSQFCPSANGIKKSTGRCIFVLRVTNLVINSVGNHKKLRKDGINMKEQTGTLLCMQSRRRVSYLKHRQV